MAASDIDGDGDLDLAVATWFGDDVTVLLGNGDATFAAGSHYGAGDAPSSITVGDLDGDADLDVAVTNVGSDDLSVLLNLCEPPPCLDVISQEVVCHADGTTFTVNIEGLNACTGGTTQVTFTASGGAVGEELCFTALVNDGGFCCTTEICVTIPDCTPAGLLSDLNSDILDLLILLGNWR